MDAGRVAEFDTPLNLFDKEDSTFRSLCNEANLSRQDIVKIRTSVEVRGASVRPWLRSGVDRISTTPIASNGRAFGFAKLEIGRAHV